VTEAGNDDGAEQTAAAATPSTSSSAAITAENAAEQLASLAAKIREAMSSSETGVALLAEYESLVRTRVSLLEDEIKRLRPDPERWEYPRKVDRATLVPYPKQLLTFRQQAERLLSRGMAGDVDAMERKLSSTNYYRLSGYFYFFREHQGAQRHLGEQFREGTTFDEVWQIYEFDSRLRALVNAAIEKIEVAVRTQVSYHHGHAHDLFAYALNPEAIKFATIEQDDGTVVNGRDVFLLDLQRLLTRSKEQFIEHFYRCYSDRYPPIYVTSEVLTLGAINRIYEGSPLEVRREIANHFRLQPRVLASWLLTLNTARNVCAHHGRFWNRVLGSRPSVPDRKTHPQFHKPFGVIAQPYRGEDGKTIQPPTTFAILSICNYLLTEIDKNSHWASAIRTLLDEYPGVKRLAMGIPANWLESSIWSNATPAVTQPAEANAAHAAPAITQPAEANAAQSAVDPRAKPDAPAVTQPAEANAVQAAAPAVTQRDE